MGGAVPGKDFLAIIKQAGFADAEMVSETGLNSSPVTRGVLFRAVRPALSASDRRSNSMDTGHGMSTKKTFDRKGFNNG
jgi:hypothetical protein